MPSADFLTRCQAKTAEVRVIFTIGAGYEDWSDYVISISPISRDSELTSGYVQVVVDNGGGDFDDYLDDYSLVEVPAQISFEFTDLAEDHTLFTGQIDAVELGLKTATFTIKDKMATCLAQSAGTNVTPYEVDGTATLVKNFVYTLLTTYGKLYDSHLESNPDIDIVSWSSWGDEMEDSGNEYALSAYLNGQNVGWCLKKIMELTNSYFWVNGEGRICFAHATGGPLGSIIYTQQYCLDRKYYTTMDGVMDYIMCRYGLDNNTGDWAGFVADQLIVYTVGTDWTEEDTSIWHSDETSATRYVDEALARLNPPISTFTIRTPLAGFVSDISNMETLYQHYDSPNDNISIMVEQITYDLMNWECEIKGSKLWSIS